MIKSIRQAFPNLLIIVGGQAFNLISDNSIADTPKILMISDLYMLEKFIDTLNKQ